MASDIPLPALSIQTPQQPDVVGGFERLLALKSMLGQQKMQGIQTQQAEQGLTDQQATTKALHDWDGQNFDDVPGLILKNGGSANAVFKARDQIVDYQTKLSALTKDQLANEKTKNDYFAQQIDNVKNLPPEQQADAFESAKADAVQRGHLDPKVAQTLTYQGPDQLDMLEKNLVGHSAAVEQAAKAAETQKNVAQANEANVNTALQQVKLNLTKNSRPGDFDAQIDKLAPASGSFAPLNQQLKVMVNGALSRGDYESAQRLLTQGFQQVGEITKETNPDVVAARAQAAAQTAQIVEPLRQSILAGFQNNKDARDKIEGTVLKPYQDKVTEIDELNSAIGQAQQGNIAAARAALYKVIGVSQPQGTHRVAPTEVTGFSGMGSIPQRIAGSIANALSGDPWTPQMVQDIKSFGEGQRQAATQSLDTGIDNVNKLYNTNVGRGLQSTGGGAGPQKGFTRIKASDGSVHDLPTENVAAARKRDPNLQVIQ